MPKTRKRSKKAVKKSTRKTAKKPVRRKKAIKKAAKKTVKKRKTLKKSTKKPITKSKTKRKKAAKKPIWASHVEKMQTKIDDALKKLEKDIKRKAPYKIIEADNNELLMLLGECNYIVREFHENFVK
ncbi:MAG: hypothetical protein K1060chlam1_00101 [Candidatus Anoxychlamydiales bacterium]|nr:hypothetical protein [Candidatus Anoxychlamydiales bacterium]